MRYKEITLEKRNEVAVLTLNRPKVGNNISDRAVVDEIVHACMSVQNDKKISVMILTGAGSIFCAGGNIKNVQNRTETFAGDMEQIRNNYREGILKVPLAIQKLDVPLIVAVNGPAMGAGCDLACMCDIRIASENARFSQSFVSLGLISGDGGTFFLPRIIGFAKALELCLTCRVIDAREALKIGLVSEVTAPDELMGRAMEVAEEIAVHPARTVRMAKRFFYLTQGKSLEETLEIAASFQAICHHLPEHLQAMEKMAAAQKKRSRK